MRGSAQFDEEYFRTGFGPDPYERTPNWLTFYGGIADNIIGTLNPRTVLDAGCALGMVVESLWDRNVHAEGIDISSFAIENVRPDMRPYCRVGSLIEPLERQYELIICIEVLEHMQHDDCLLAIKEFSNATDAVLFSSTPDDFEEVTHVNVKPILAWISLFAEFGFTPDLNYDASYITSHAILFRKGEALQNGVTRLFAEHIRQRKHLLDEHGHLAELSRELDGKISELSEIESHCEELTSVTSENAIKMKTLKAELSIEVQRTHSLQSELDARRIAAEVRLDPLPQPDNGPLLAMNEELKMRLAHMEQSTTWQMMSPLRRLSAYLPSSIRSGARRIVKAVYWGITPHKMPSRIRFLRERRLAAARPADAVTLMPAFSSYIPSVHEASKPAFDVATSYRALYKKNFPSLSRVPVYVDSSSQGTVTVLTDSLEHHSLFGGVATAIVVAAMIAEKQKYRLRIATRTGPPDLAAVGLILSINGIKFDGAIVSAYVPLENSPSLSIGHEDIVLTTSWWTTHAIRKSIPDHQILYLLQEDERMFYSYGDTRLLCAELLGDDRLVKLINSELLYAHLYDGPDPLNGRANAIAFEPAFPPIAPAPSRKGGAGRRKKFFFYARPNHERNLFWRGVEALDRCVLKGIFPPDEWDICFVGPGCPDIVLSNGIRPNVIQSLSWDEYVDFLTTVDVGLSLMYTPHTSYPPLDLAASGAIVVTNKFGIKDNLRRYSANIILSELDVDDLVTALSNAVARSDDRRSHVTEGTIERNWCSVLSNPLQGAMRKLGR